MERKDCSNLIRYLPLYRAALADDWKSAEPFFKQYQDADTAGITNGGATALHIAVGSNSCHLFVEKLINRIAANDKTKLRTPDKYGNTALHYAAKIGNTKAARALVEQDPEMTNIVNRSGSTAVRYAASCAQKETLDYLLSTTSHVAGEDGISPYSGVAGADLVTLSIKAGFYDVAMSLIEKYPNLVIEKDTVGHTPLQKLAIQPKAFPSGQSWWLWQHIIYICIPLNYTSLSPLDAETSKEKPSNLPRNRKMQFIAEVCFRFYDFIWRAAKYLVPSLKTIHDKKLEHKQTNQLMKAMISKVFNVSERYVVWDVLGTAMSTAVKQGIHELVEECLRQHPGLIWFKFERLHLIVVAIKYRQHKVYNLVYQMAAHWLHGSKVYSSEVTALYWAGSKASPDRLNTVTGAALQMQRELQWFKEVEKSVLPAYTKDRDAANKTPREIFTDEHKDLVEKGEKWMKDTASSSMVVAALIVTVAFAAIFTVPGGNNEVNGTPYFICDSTFMLFAISDAMALFSSITSVLMFLAILTSRYAEEDFLYALPKRITIGLLALFISIVAIVVTFCAALALVLREKLAWIAIPVGLIACGPVTFFALLHFPMFVELVLSTYGPSIFRKQDGLMFH